jgi:hypothetical protein
MQQTLLRIAQFSLLRIKLQITSSRPSITA